MARKQSEQQSKEEAERGRANRALVGELGKLKKAGRRSSAAWAA
jgi:hypothetical protein